MSTLAEFRAARAVLDEVAEELRAEGHPIPKRPPVGIMVEVPATAVMAAQFAREADFFSIGTNDLTQYTLAMDRGHPKLAPFVDGLSPGVLHAQLGPYSPPQTYNPYARPTISPYLNMLRTNVNPALNYYGLVRPQMQTSRALQAFQQELLPVAGGLPPAVEQASAASSLLPTTGHRTSFYNYSTYFPSSTGTTGGTLGGMTPGNRPTFGTLGGARAPRSGAGR